jgi:N-acetylglutamate synthase-like GNAT family acetyltransferase
LLDIRTPGFGDPDWLAAVALRRAILRTPLGLDYSADDLAREAADTLFAAYDEGRLVGVVMLRLAPPDGARLRQMAVAFDMRGRGIGEQLVAALEAQARQLGLRQIQLAARLTARGFYERCGYDPDGEIFTEVTLPHIHMSKTLQLASVPAPA